MFRDTSRFCISRELPVHPPLRGCAPAASTILKVPLQLLEVAEQFPSLAELADRADNPRILAQQWLLHVLLELRGHMDQVPG